MKNGIRELTGQLKSLTSPQHVKGLNLVAKPTLKAGIYSLYKYKFERLVVSLDLFRKYSYYICNWLSACTVDRKPS